MTTSSEPPIRAELRIHTICLTILTVLAVGLALSWLQLVMIPLVVAAFLAIALMPLVDWLEVWVHVPRTIAVCGALILALLALTGLLILTYTAIVQITSTAGQYQAQVEKFIIDASNSAPMHWLGLKPLHTAAPRADDNSRGGDVKVDPSDVREPIDSPPLESVPTKEQINPLSLIPASTVQTFLIGATNSILGVLRQSVLVLVFLFFLLLSSVKRDHPIGGAWGAMEGRIRAYIITMTTLSGVTGVLVGIVLWFFGVQAAVLFGLLTFFFNFIPNVGSLVSILLPIPIVCFSHDLSTPEKWMAILIPAAIQSIIGTFIQPKMMGESMKLHPVVIVVSLIFWGTLWGFVGVFLAVPITSIIRIVCDRHPLTKPVANLMAGQLDALREEPLMVPASDVPAV